MRNHTVRIVAQKQKDGRVEITALDTRTGRVASKRTTPGGNAEADLRRSREAFEKAGNRVDVVER